MCPKKRSCCSKGWQFQLGNTSLGHKCCPLSLCSLLGLHGSTIIKQLVMKFCVLMYREQHMIGKHFFVSSTIWGCRIWRIKTVVNSFFFTWSPSYMIVFHFLQNQRLKWFTSSPNQPQSLERFYQHLAYFRYFNIHFYVEICEKTKI